MKVSQRIRSATLCVAWAGAFAILAAGCGDDDGSGDGGAGKGGSGGNTPSGGTGGGGGTGSPSGGSGGAKAGSGGATPSGGRGGSGGSGGGGAGASGAGTGGSGGGSSGAGAGGAGSGGAPASGASVLERNLNPAREGHYVQPGLTKANAAKMAIDAGFMASFTGNTWAAPLYLESGPNNKGAFFAVTTGNDVFALDETTGAQVWKHNIGSSPTSTGAGCGNISPVGIISTPVIDGAAKTIYVAGAIGTNSITRHEIHALSTDDGSLKSGWPVDVTKIKAGSLAFTPAPHNQRSALSLVNGTVYVAYGGHIGDCGNYHGWVVGVDAKDPTKTGAWATGGQGEGIWAAGGLASDGTSVFAVTGNRTGGGGAHQDSEQVVRISGLGQFTRDNKNLFFPSRWMQMDSTDADFGGSSPTYITLPGATLKSYLVAIAKDGHMYLLDPASLGGSNGSTPVVDFQVSTGNMSIRTTPAVFPKDDGVILVFTADSGGQCPSGGGGGGGGGRKIMAVEIPAGSPPAPKVLWCASQTGNSTSPIVTTTDGKSEPIVWFGNGDKINAVDGLTGAMITTGGSGSCTTAKWTSPIAVKGRIVVSANNKLCSWSAH